MAEPPAEDHRRNHSVPGRRAADRKRADFGLPAPLTSFIGRDREIENIAKLLADRTVRLITLTGPGGVGKTRLALQVTQTMSTTFPDGVAFVSLASVADPALFASTVATALHVPDLAHQDPEVAVQEFLRDLRFLLILDNLEHLLPAAVTASAWLGVCPNLTILVTSTARLAVSGEQTVEVRPLDIPSLQELPLTELLGKVPSVQLFIERARAVRSEFALTEENSSDVAAICARLDGLPLAIELAAARSLHLPPSALVTRLDQRLRILTGGPRDQPERLGTMRNAIAWSHDLLTEPEQVVFRRISVFIDGFGLAAAEAVGGDTLDQIASLVDKSLLQLVESPDGEPRYRMLETIREYGLERLSTSGEEESVRMRHAGWMLSLTQSHGTGVSAEDPATWILLVERDLGNVRAALTFAESAENTDLGVRLAASTYKLWQFRGRRAEGRGWLERALARDSGQPTAERAAAVQALGFLQSSLGDSASAVESLDESLAIARALSDTEIIQYSTWGLAAVALDSRDYGNRTAQLLAESEQMATQRSDTSGVAVALLLQGVLARRRRDFSLAEERVLIALALYREQSHQEGMSWCLRDLGSIAADRGDAITAAARFVEAMEHIREFGSPDEIAIWLSNVARLAVTTGHSASAVRWLATAAKLIQHHAFVISPPDQDLFQQATNDLRVKLGTAEFLSAWRAGTALAGDESVSEALRFGTSLTDSGSGKGQGVGANAGLTRRELQVVSLVAEGLSDSEIAESLFIAQGTVRTHLTNAYHKLGVASRTAAIAAARREGIL